VLRHLGLVIGERQGRNIIYACMTITLGCCSPSLTPSTYASA
jgi:hypothetical protein